MYNIISTEGFVNFDFTQIQTLSSTIFCEKVPPFISPSLVALDTYSPTPSVSFRGSFYLELSAYSVLLLNDLPIPL